MRGIVRNSFLFIIIFFLLFFFSFLFLFLFHCFISIICLSSVADFHLILRTPIRRVMSTSGSNSFHIIWIRLIHIITNSEYSFLLIQSKYYGPCSPISQLPFPHLTSVHYSICFFGRSTYCFFCRIYCVSIFIRNLSLISASTVASLNTPDRSQLFCLKQVTGEKGLYMNAIKREFIYVSLMELPAEINL